MRLVCPNCEAKYEVPEDAIPETGRDVQCANCGHAWYQMRSRPAASEPAASAVPVAGTEPDDEPEDEPLPDVEVPEPEIAPPPVEVPEEPPAEVPGVEETPVVETPETADIRSGAEPEAVPFHAPEAGPIPAAPDLPGASEVTAVLAAAAQEPLSAAASSAAASSVVEAVAETGDDVLPDPVMTGGTGAVAPPQETDAKAAPMPETSADADADEEDAPAVLAASAGAKPAAYAVDESVLAILREEAEREAQARRGEMRPLETQTDLGIEAAIPAARKSFEAASAGSLAGHADMGDDGRPAARRDLLPNVEEINSTLRPAEDPSEEELAASAQAAEGGSGFRSGFLLVLTATILTAALYLGADALSEMVPALAAPLQVFTAVVDSLRLQLDGLMQTATAAINGEGS